MSFLRLAPSDDPAYIDAASGASTSYRELLSEVSELARPLTANKQLVAIHCRNDRFTLTAYAATQLHGHAALMLDGSRPVAEQVDTLAAYRPDWVAGPPGTAEALAEAAAAVRDRHELAGGELVSLSGSDAPMDPDLAVLLGTSGTTGSSKYVRLSAAAVMANAGSIAEYLGLTPVERPVTSLPLHYSFGLSVLNSHWLVGAAVVVSAESVIQKGFWEAVRRNGCTSLAGVPYTYQLLERVGYRELDLPALATMQQAGGALDRRLTTTYHEHMQAKGGRLLVMYGQTEATARMAYVPPTRLSEKLGSAGRAIPRGELRVEEAEPDIAGRMVGEVVYEGPNVMLGYATGRDDLARGDELGGVLRTGDLGYLDEDGFLFLTGRSKRIAKVFGLRVNLDEIELLLREHGPAAAVAGDERVRGACAFGSDEELARLRTALAQRLHVHPSAFELRRVEDIPVTSSGKVDYRAVERLLGAA